MSLIERAAKRLEELRRSGIGSGDSEHATGAGEAEAPSPEALMRVIEARKESLAASIAASSVASAAGVPRSTPTAAATAAETATATNAPEDLSIAALHLPRRQSSGRNVSSRAVSIDLEGLKARGYVTPDVPGSPIADEFRVIKRPIIRNATGRAGARVRNGNLVMITSSVASEGKTFTAVNLAMSIAMELDITVLLVDGDVANPGLPPLLGVPDAPGLLDLLTDEKLDVADALVRTNIDKLSILPAGSPHRRATELLASEQMTLLLRDLASRYADRIIIFDSPPLLPTTEARVLATHMGQIVMVVAAESTSQNAVSQALVTIENCEHVMMMLNKASRTDVSEYGHYPTSPRR
jgi:receptor protein-tyrosine kinase